MLTLISVKLFTILLATMFSAASGKGIALAAISLIGTTGGTPQRGGGAPVQNNNALQSIQTGNFGTDLANALTNVGVINLGGGRDIVPLPATETYTVASVGGASCTNFTAFAFNEDYLNKTATNNGSGAASVTTTYTDGSTSPSPSGSPVNFNGALISRVAGAYRKAAGIICYGFDIDYSNTAGEYPTGLGQANVVVQYYNGDNTTTPLKVDITAAKRNTRYISGELTVLKKFNISRFAQWTGNVPNAGSSSTSTMTMTVIFYFQAQAGQTTGMAN